MESPDTLNRLCYHAGLEEINGQANQPIVCLASQNLPFKDSLEEVIELLQLLNYEVNGSPPSESQTAQTDFSRRLIYAVSEIIRQIREAKSANVIYNRELDSAAWKIEIAWSAVLAGDIDSIYEQIAGQMWARGK